MNNLNLLKPIHSTIFPLMTQNNYIPRGISILALPALIKTGYQTLLVNVMMCDFIGDLTIGSLSHIATAVGLGTSLLIDAAMLAMTAIGSIRSLKIGMTGGNEALSAHFPNPVTKTVLSTLGMAGLSSIALRIKNLALGLIAYQSLDSEQQHFVVKHRSVEFLPGQPGNCRAVVIDGASSEWGNKKDDVTNPIIQTLYRNCDVRTYRINPDANTPVCDAVEKGKKALEGPLDILMIHGHGNEEEIVLSNRHIFTGSQESVVCLKNHLQPDAQMILSGCNTATGTNSLAEKVSRHIEGIEVVGFSSYLNPLLTASSLSEKKLGFWNFIPMDSHNNLVLGNNVRTFVTGQQSKNGG